MASFGRSLLSPRLANRPAVARTGSAHFCVKFIMPLCQDGGGIAILAKNILERWLKGEVEEGRATMVHSANLSRQIEDNWALSLPQIKSGRNDDGVLRAMRRAERGQPTARPG